MPLYFRNPANAYVEKVYGMWSFLWAFLFGPFYFLYKGAWPATLVLVFVAVFVAPRDDLLWWIVMFAVWLGFAMASRSIVRRVYLRKGWVEASDPKLAPPRIEPRAEPAFWSQDRRV